MKFHKSLGKSTVHVFVALLRLYFWSNLSKGLWRASAPPKFILKMDGDYSFFFPTYFLVSLVQFNPNNHQYILFVSLVFCWEVKLQEAAATAATSLQSCPTLCDPIDGSPPGSTVPGILQARTLEWVAISFSNA